MEKLILCADVEWEAAAALALLAGSKQWELLGIVAGNGRVQPRISAENAACVMARLRRSVPVFCGTDCAMVADISPLRKSWEPSARKGPAFGRLPDELSSPDPAPPAPSGGVLWLAETLSKSGEKITVLTLGPLTDLALALRLRPQIVEHIREILIVGGGHRYADATPCAEFNIRCDPEAAAIVMGCSCPKTLVPLDCAYSVLMDWEPLSQAFPPGGRGALAGRLLELLFTRDGGAVPLPALVGVCALCNSKVLRGTLPYSVDVDFSGGYADGRTVFDTRRIFEDYNCKTAFEADEEQYLSTLRSLAAEF